MRNILVSRHIGAVQWCTKQGLKIDICVAHLDIASIDKGDKIIGTLPINLAAEVIAKGGRYLHLSLCVPFAWRGQELTYQQMDQAGAHLQEYSINKVG